MPSAAKRHTATQPKRIVCKLYLRYHMEINMPGTLLKTRFSQLNRIRVGKLSVILGLEGPKLSPYNCLSSGVMVRSNKSYNK